MPAYDFHCPECGSVEERFMKYSEFVNYERGETAFNCSCGSRLVYMPTFYYTSPAQRFEPVVIHRDAAGNVRFPGHKNDKVPTGFQKVELTDLNQVRRFEREMETKQVGEAVGWQNTRQKFLDGQLRANREAVQAIREGGEWQGVEDGRIVTRRGLTPRGQRFYDRMREASEHRQREGARAKSPAFHIEVFSNHESRTKYTD